MDNLTTLEHTLTTAGTTTAVNTYGDHLYITDNTGSMRRIAAGDLYTNIERETSIHNNPDMQEMYKRAEKLEDEAKQLSIAMEYIQTLVEKLEKRINEVEDGGWSA